MSPPDTKPILAPAPGPDQTSAPNAASSNANASTTRAGASAQSAPRPRQRKRAVPIEPDSLYRGASASASISASAVGHGTQGFSGAGAKRGAQDRTDGEPRKRKRVDPNIGSNASANLYTKQSANAHMHGHGHPGVSSRTGAGSAIASAVGSVAINGNSFGSGSINSTGLQVAGDTDGQPSLFEFSTLPTSALYEYIIQFNLVPMIYPTPLTADDPPPPALLLDPARMASRAPTPTPLATPANRPRRIREPKEAGRRRSTRLIEDELRGGGIASALDQVPVLADVAAVHGVLAAIAARHFRESSVREVDTLASFMGAVKARVRR
ncbi:uncharacterized protein FOMMEDRAFT_28148 [Fomitiporia mediterranea MF3/22]|uniref:uncharacterized protein n=1 Tax=Fomitiporia mediterranea (strain MF3/22) TaxID=694068 RepID=UPI00044094CD|nr:uncharacterized protein FOMMEDRAFT_28148 [Fomitiporia mediterranea MF3/22]EJD04452.1 hypothetical protein FOMMEDRAFT_28148 [Fomitiporia mediterranea MF3/22]